MGVAPVVIGLFLFCSVQLFFIGVLGEYIGAIHTQVLRRPHVVEKERLNFAAKSPKRTRMETDDTPLRKSRRPVVVALTHREAA